MSRPYGIAGRLAAAFIHSKLTPLIVLGSLALGLLAVVALPREEEPQIIVPMIDVFVQVPGASPTEVEQRVTRPMEKLIWEIPGVEYVYSTSSPGVSMVIVRFRVGELEEPALVRLNQKLASNFDMIPPGASLPLVKPRSIDDVPIMGLTLWSPRYDDFQLRQVAGQLHEALKEVDDVSAVEIIGGRTRQVSVEVDPARLASYGLDPALVSTALQGANVQPPATNIVSGNESRLVQSGSWLSSVDAVKRVVVGSRQNVPVFVSDVAAVRDDDAEPSSYVTFLGRDTRSYPAVTLAISKRKGTNAIAITRRVEAAVARLRGTVLPSEINVTVTRNYGETAQHKSNELLCFNPHLADARPARGRRGARRGSGDPGPDALRLLHLRLHPQPHYALRADLLDRHPGG
jgi:multidrug efflux pump subunit AcrB